MPRKRKPKSVVSAIRRQAALKRWESLSPEERSAINKLAASRVPHEVRVQNAIEAAKKRLR
jgi:hypothetical protein